MLFSNICDRLGCIINGYTHSNLQYEMFFSIRYLSVCELPEILLQSLNPHVCSYNPITVAAIAIILQLRFLACPDPVLLLCLASLGLGGGGVMRGRR
jgi:hypothetical protein